MKVKLTGDSRMMISLSCVQLKAVVISKLTYGTITPHEINLNSVAHMNASMESSNLLKGLIFEAVRVLEPDFFFPSLLLLVLSFILFL